MVRAVARDIDADLSHDQDGTGVEPMRFGAGRDGGYLSGKIVVDNAIGYLAAAGIAGTKEKDLQGVGQSMFPSSAEADEVNTKTLLDAPESPACARAETAEDQELRTAGDCRFERAGGIDQAETLRSGP